MSQTDRKYQPVQYSIWVVDDDVTVDAAVQPLRGALRRFLRSLAPTESPPSEARLSHLEIGLPRELGRQLCNAEIWRFAKMIGAGETARPGPVDVVVYYFDSWKPLEEYLQGTLSMGRGPIYRLWPSIVITDLYDAPQAENLNVEGERVAQLAGFSLGNRAAEHRIPCVIVTSHSETMVTHGSEFQDIGRRECSWLYYMPRRTFGERGEAVLRKIWDYHAARLFWIPEFKYEVEAYREGVGRTFTVTVTSQGQVQSQMGDVSGTAYAQLYLSCYGSLLSVAMGYSEADLADWESTRCVTVCTPSSDGRYVPKPINNLTPNLEPDFSHEKLNFQLGSRRQRGYKLLQLNIVHLAVPEPNTLPAYYQGRTLIRVIESLRRILPQDGLAWLEAEVGR